MAGTGCPGREKRNSLPDYYTTVADDLIGFCGSANGRIWVDLGCGSGGVALALMGKLPESFMILLDPDARALADALLAARDRGVKDRTVAVTGTAECIPMPDESVDVVVSRGSFYFWKDRAQGLREIWRILRPGGRAMIGGGLGRDYPEWARKEFIRRRRKSAENKGPEAAKEFAEARSPETFRRLAEEAHLPGFTVTGEGGLGTEDNNTGMGIWLQFEKKEEDVNE